MSGELPWDGDRKGLNDTSQLLEEAGRNLLIGRTNDSRITADRNESHLNGASSSMQKSRPRENAAEGRKQGVRKGGPGAPADLPARGPNW